MTKSDKWHAHLKRLEAEKARKRMQAARAAIQTDADLFKVMRARAEEDFFFFTKDVLELGQNPDPDGPRVTEDQRELAQFLQTPQKKPFRMILTPRDTLKSTMLEAYVLWRLVKNPNLRVLLYGEVHEQAQKRLAKIKRLLLYCTTFRRCFGDLQGDVWNENMILLKSRTNSGIREMSIETAGLDVVVNARHFDLIIADDIHSEKNTKTREQIDQVEEKVDLLMPLLTKSGNMIFCGVYWTDGDFYCRLSEKNAPDLEVFKRTIWKHNDPTQGPAYPNQLPLEKIETNKRKMRSDLFSCHYLLDPVPREYAVFKREYFQTVPKASLPEGVRIYMAVDQAGDPSSETEARRDSDYTGMVVVAVTPAQDLVILDCFHGRLDPTEAVEQALTFILRHRPHVVGVEKAGVGNLAFYLRERLRKMDLWALVEDVKPEGRSKLERVLALEPLARRRKIFVSDTAQMTDVFFQEIERVSFQGIKAKHDDIIDACAYILDLLRLYGGTPEDLADAKPWEGRLKHLSANSQDYWRAVYEQQERETTPTTWTQEFV